MWIGILLLHKSILQAFFLYLLGKNKGTCFFLWVKGALARSFTIYVETAQGLSVLILLSLANYS